MRKVEAKMSKIFTPTNQTRLTNVAVVRMKKGGKRFEIACYRNKVISWRTKLEKDIDEVLQTHIVFANVSKIQLAKKEDLVNVFGMEDQTEICREILAKGELQVSHKERQSALDQMFKDIVALVSDMCINQKTKRGCSMPMIEKALKDINFSVKPDRNVRQQAIDVIPLLKAVISVARRQMRLKIEFVGKDGYKLKEKVLKFVTKVEEETFVDGRLYLTCSIDHGKYVSIDGVLMAEPKKFKGYDILDIIDITEGEY